MKRHSLHALPARPIDPRRQALDALTARLMKLARTQPAIVDWFIAHGNDYARRFENEEFLRLHGRGGAR
jgi:hypothetical protein